MLLPLALVAALQLPPAVDSLAGTWTITMEAMGNTVDETCTLAQRGSVIAGTCSGTGGQTAAVTGEVRNGKFTFKHANDRDGQQMTLVFTGTVGSATALKGAVEVQPMGITGTFTASPAVPAKP